MCSSDGTHLIKNFLINSKTFPVPVYHPKTRSVIDGNIYLTYNCTWETQNWSTPKKTKKIEDNG